MLPWSNGDKGQEIQLIIQVQVMLRIYVFRFKSTDSCKSVYIFPLGYYCTEFILSVFPIQKDDQLVIAE